MIDAKRLLPVIALALVLMALAACGGPGSHRYMDSYWEGRDRHTSGGAP